MYPTHFDCLKISSLECEKYMKQLSRSFDKLFASKCRLSTSLKSVKVAKIEIRILMSDGHMEKKTRTSWSRYQKTFPVYFYTRGNKTSGQLVLFQVSSPVFKYAVSHRLRAR